MKPLDIVEGALASDGCLGYRSPAARFAYFDMDLSGASHVDWLEMIRCALLELHMYAAVPKTSTATSRGKPYLKCRLTSYAHPALSLLREVWYTNGRKTIPETFVLTPVSLAGIVMGDVSTQWVLSKYVRVVFCTESYDSLSIVRLRSGLELLGISTFIDSVGLGRRIYIRQSKYVSRLMETIEPYIVPSYRYKIKRPGR